MLEKANIMYIMFYSQIIAMINKYIAIDFPRPQDFSIQHS